MTNWINAFWYWFSCLIWLQTGAANNLFLGIEQGAGSSNGQSAFPKFDNGSSMALPSGQGMSGLMGKGYSFNLNRRYFSCKLNIVMNSNLVSTSSNCWECYDLRANNHHHIRYSYKIYYLQDRDQGRKILRINITLYVIDSVWAGQGSGGFLDLHEILAKCLDAVLVLACLVF